MDYPNARHVLLLAIASLILGVAVPAVFRHQPRGDVEELVPVASRVSFQAFVVPTPKPTPVPTPKPAPAPVVSAVVPAGSIWIAVADCETGDGDGKPPYRADWSYNGPSGYDGGLQFLPSTWRLAGGTRFAPFAYLATPAQQIEIADGWLARTGWDSQWPGCSKELGLT